MKAEKIQQYAESIAAHIEEHESLINRPGLFLGRYGQLLLYAYLYEFYQKEAYAEKVYTLIAISLEELEDSISRREAIDMTLGSGLSGFLWVLHHLISNHMLDESLDELIDENLQKLVLKSTEVDMGDHNYDPLYGYIGKCAFLLQQKDKDFGRKGLEQLIASLHDTKVLDEKGNYTWVDVRRQDRSSINYSRHIMYDCGLAHGVAGIISFCCDIYQQVEDVTLRGQTEDLIRKASLWLLDQENPEGDFRFPYAKFQDAKQPENDRYYARLGWCYGDICVAFTLSKAGKMLSSAEFTDHALRIALSSTAIKKEMSGVVKEDLSVDPSFCHGTCGIAYIYLKLYESLADERLHKAYTYWKEITEEEMDYCLENHSLHSNLSMAQEDFGFLYGYVGLGLVSLSLEQEKSAAWDKLLLL